MVSGDHMSTAKAVAIKAGIMSEQESEQKYVCMTGEEFRKFVGTIKKSYDD